MAKLSTQDRQALLAKIQADFDARLAALAADPLQWIEFIEQVAIFGAHYSVNNQILLMLQAEERGITPRYFLPYGRKDRTTGWLSHGRQVRPGERAFRIWAPITRRPSEQDAQQWEAEGRTVRREQDGRPAVQVVGFSLAATFDISQTDGAAFTPPTVQYKRRIQAAGGRAPELLTGDDPTGAYDDLVGLITAAGYTFELAAPGSPYLGAKNGVTVTGPGVHVVKVRDDISTAQRTKTTVHELAHIRCGHTAGAQAGGDLHRGRQETEAESVAHIVCTALGLDSRAYSDAYVLGWADGDLDLVKSCATTVLRVARQILHDLTPSPAPLEPHPAADDASPAGDSSTAR
ncbi:ArdC family protein [Phytohabitans houttuyneae]|uniref:N-terminal domain-containing protein n=1 Tax=Phytohabitans houttuyneae TaxID=1076126 RepID=A0A6V8KJF8_9ACTN|nr:ArdC family protein [Phytohabitans houttuyneae]GFJ82106.1 hypothetical protein Phou_062860 [Phytohabitans houttuyneae]